MELAGLSITELKQLLARVNHDLKLNKPTIKRIKKNITPILSEYAECNIIAQKFTGTKALSPVHNAKLKADIQIQKDILDFIHNGGNIKVAKTRTKVKCQTFRNNKYSIANQGHQASITGKYGFFASPNKVSL
jgi:phage-related protein